MRSFDVRTVQTEKQNLRFSIKLNNKNQVKPNHNLTPLSSVWIYVLIRRN